MAKLNCSNSGLKFFVFQGMPAKAQKNMEMEFEELLDMVPYEQMVNLGMEYAMSDSQVKSFMYYISSDKFRDNLIQLELTPQFVEVKIIEFIPIIDCELSELSWIWREQTIMNLNAWKKKFLHLQIKFFVGKVGDEKIHFEKPTKSYGIVSA